MLFGKKKKEELVIPEHQEEIKLPTLEEIKQIGMPIQLEKEKSEEVEEKTLPKIEKSVALEEKPRPIFKKSIPLFIKVERYEEILENIEELRSIIELIKSSLSIFEESERVREETIELIRENANRFENRLNFLKSALLAEGVKEERREEIQRKSEMKEVLSNLKAQIEKLREEIQSMG
ncbi:MAG: hypothetical protein QW451_02045 [Candidatus Aenigmatarchaeota archaeon]